MSELKPIERDESYDRTYIPLPGDFEVQTKGKGSTFRIVDGVNDFRLPISPQPYLFDILERMARASHEAITASHQRIAAAEKECQRYIRLSESDYTRADAREPFKMAARNILKALTPSSAPDQNTGEKG